MGKFDFLDNLGESSKNFSKISTDKVLQEQLELLEILLSRGLTNKEFKDELSDLLVKKKITPAKFFENVQMSIKSFENVRVKITGVDKNMFKEKNDQLEYIGDIARMPDDKRGISKDRGKISYTFAVQLFEKLESKETTVKEMIILSDLLGVKMLRVFDWDQLP